MKYSNATGERFGKWTVTADNGNRNKKVRRVSVLCDCGRKSEVCYRELSRGRSSSCKGCVKVKHGLSYHPLHGTWKGMMRRCYSDKHEAFKNYGGRGIDVYKPFHDAGTFIKWVASALGERPEGHTLDRVDNDRGYYPDNLRWADRETQNANRRK